MAVKSSGTIGITTDVVAEFGGSAPHGLTEYYRGGAYVPNSSVNSSIPASGKIGLTSFYGSQNIMYFSSATFVLEDTGVEALIPNGGVLIGSNVFVHGTTSDPSSYSNNYNYIMSTDDGTVSNMKSWASASLSDGTYYPYEFQNGFVYNGTRIYGSGKVGNSSVAYLTTSVLYANGTPQYYKYSASGLTLPVPEGAIAAPDGTVYCFGSGTDGTYYKGFVGQVNSIAGLGWIKTIANTSAGFHQYIYSCGADSQSNVYSVLNPSTNGVCIVKTNSSGTIAWGRSFPAGSFGNAQFSGAGYCNKIVFDSADNGYCAAISFYSPAGSYSVPPAGYKQGILKFTSAGASSLFKYYNTLTSSYNVISGVPIVDLAIDSDRLFFAAYNTTRASYGLVAKANTSIAVQSAIKIEYFPVGVGTISTSSSSSIVTGTGTNWDNYILEFQSGIELLYANGVSVGIVASRDSNTQLTLLSNASATVTNQTYYKMNYNYIDTISVSSNTVYVTGGFTQMGWSAPDTFVLKIPDTLDSYQTKVVSNYYVLRLSNGSSEATLTSDTLGTSVSFTATATSKTATTYDLSPSTNTTIATYAANIASLA